MIIKINKNTLFFYFLAFILLLLPVVSINHNLTHTLTNHQQNSYFQQKIQYLNIVKHQHNHQHFCLLCSVWQQNKFSTFFTAFFTLLAFTLLQKTINKHNFSFPSFIYSFLKTGPPLK